LWADESHPDDNPSRVGEVDYGSAHPLNALSMDAPHIAILAGLTVEVAGAFVLAADAIGLDRLERTAAAFLRVEGELTGAREPTDSLRHPGAARIALALICAGGAGVGSLFGTHPPIWALGMPRILVVVGACLLGGAVGLALYWAALTTLRAAVGALQAVELRAKGRGVGVLGFSLLFIGFVLQFFGTFADGLSRHLW
jgi:hypothetical protein